MKKVIALMAISLLTLLTSCGEVEVIDNETPVVEDATPEIIGENVDGLLTDEEIDKELEEIFNID